MRQDLLASSCVYCGVSYRDQPGASEDWIGASRKTEKVIPGCISESLYNYCLWADASCYSDLCDCFDRWDSSEVVLCDSVTGFSSGCGAVVGGVERTGDEEDGGRRLF